MPRLSEFYGIVIYMYWRDHGPPHFHAIYGGHEAQVRIQDGIVMDGFFPEWLNAWFANGRNFAGTSSWTTGRGHRSPKPSSPSSPFGRLDSRE